MRADLFRDAATGLLDLVFPLRCAGCRRGGTAWCRTCAGELGGLRRVDRPLFTGEVPVYALGRYRRAARRAVLAFKESGQRHLAEPLGQQLGTGLRALADQVGLEGRCCLVPAPSKAIAARRRGGPHVLRLADRTASALVVRGWQVEVADCLVTDRSAADSTELDTPERVKNLAGRVLVRSGRLPTSGWPVVLLDDVVTTGATVAECLRVLLASGFDVRAALSLTSTSG
ncbi:ComF family protein [Saccharopolyspora sp. CA-218241]|uniref:ComF family protein n=1 Tax=Saccharopolyspora sp. CA-218241 TaxID=3240027 RepID=UPI003D96FA97